MNFGSIDKQDITYVNGIEVGRTGKDCEEEYWNIHRNYTVPASAVTGHTLTIAVRVYSFIYDGGIIGAASDMNIHPKNDDASCALAGKWHFCCEHDLGLVTSTHLMGHGERNSPHILFDNMIQPLLPYALRGAIWYQGESNAGNESYARLQRDLIHDWRWHWGLPNLAFHLVQLPRRAPRPPVDYQPDSTWARLREAQAEVLSLENAGMAVTIDLGEAEDIHPKNKMPVGWRLAQSALAITYGKDLPACGPVADSFTGESGAIRCHFRFADDGLRTTDGAPPNLFFIAGDDRVFHPAEAWIEKSTVVVCHADVPRPVALRYAWADNPEGCNLANHAGLPASPFRSDRW